MRDQWRDQWIVGAWRTQPGLLAQRLGWRRLGRGEGAKLVLLGLVLVLSACAKVSVTPLGSTRDGRAQYEVTCNRRATDQGTCHEQAIALCEGSYETQNVGSTTPDVGSYNGGLFARPAERVLLIACNR